MYAQDNRFFPRKYQNAKPSQSKILIQLIIQPPLTKLARLCILYLGLPVKQDR